MEYKVLLAEDEKSLRDIVSIYLRKNGYMVDVAVNGEDAIRAVDAKVYDIIILDVMMPIKDGLEICRY
ncbi:MAG: response regulator, partial [Lachnospiraceae bacterium]|nr:response regulator [Lachnospiraceae bacterium]